MSDESSRTPVATLVEIDVPIEISVRIGGARVVSWPSSPSAPPAVECAAPAPHDIPRPVGGPDAAFEIDENYEGREGYDPDWLDETVPLPQLSAAQLKDASVDTTRDEGDGERHVLRYYHFSIAMSAKHRLMYFAACNTTRSPKLRGKVSRTALSDGKGDKWILDPRIPAVHQITTRELYSKAHVDRGHVVRREDAYWGKTARIAAFGNFDSFHYTNCTPQDKAFNRATVGDGLWGKLENHIGESAETDGDNLTYFAGPIFKGGREWDGIFIPYEFFKVVVAKRKGGGLGAWAFRLSQKALIKDLPEPVFSPGMFETYVVSIASLEERTGLTFPRILHRIDQSANQGEDRAFGSLLDIPMKPRS